MLQSSRRFCGCSQVPRGQRRLQLLFFFVMGGVSEISTMLPLLGVWADVLTSQPWLKQQQHGQAESPRQKQVSSLQGLDMLVNSLENAAN